MEKIRKILPAAFFIVISVLMIGVYVGCDELVPPKAPGADATASALLKAKVHNETASGLVKTVIPTVKGDAKTLLVEAGKQTQLTDESIDDGSAALKWYDDQYNTLYKKAYDLEGENKTIKSQWGYRTQILVERIKHWIEFLLVLHIAAGALALVPWAIIFPGWGLIVGKGLAIVGLATNPFAWFQSIRDNVWFRYIAPKAA